MRTQITLTLDVVSDETRLALIEEAIGNLLCGFEGVHCGEWADSSVADDHEVEVRVVGVRSASVTIAEAMNEMEVAASR